MSIKGFIRSQKDLTQPIKLSKTKILIDGHQIQRELYFQGSRDHPTDSKYGSNYTEFEETIKSFLRRLKICQIVPIVVYNGSIDVNRYNTAFTDRISEIKQIVSRGYECKYQSSTLCNYVFTSVLRQFGVQIIQTCAQTCNQMAVLANKLKCPVYSAKSSFYYVDIDFEIIYDTHLNCKSLSYDKSGHFWYINVRVYRLSYLLNKYYGLKPEKIPLIGAVLQNKLIKSMDYRKINDRSKGQHQICDVSDLIDFIGFKSMDEALDSLLGHISGDTKDVSQIKQLMAEHENKGCKAIIKNYLYETDYECRSLKTCGKGDVEIILPKWFVEEYQTGVIRPALMNVVQLKLHVLYPQLEDFSLESSYECTLSLRRFLYGILRTETVNPVQIKVLDRLGLSKSKNLVDPLIVLSDSLKVPFLGSIRELDITERRALFMAVLDTNESFVSWIKVSLMKSEILSEDITTVDSICFLVILMKFLIKNSKELDYKPFVGALGLSAIYYKCYDHCFDDKWTQLLISDIEDQFEPKYVHYLAQLEACLHIANFINIILEHPFREGKPYYCLNAIFLYNAVKRLSKEEEYQPFLNSMFRHRPSMANIHNRFTRLVLSNDLFEVSD